jgi:hypothetical protein
MATPSEKPTMMSDDSASETLKSATPSFNEKAHEAEDSGREGSQSPTPNPDPTVSKAAGRASTDSGLRKVHSTTKDAQDELTRVMTSGEGIEYPTGAKLTLISLALCLSVFLMALVCAVLSILADICVNTLVIGQHHYCHRYSKNHGSIPLLARCWVVWLRIFTHNCLVPTPLRKILYLLFHQICLSHCNWHFRAREFDMWYCTKLDCIDHWPCYCWTGIFWDFFRSSDHRCLLRTVGKETNVHRIYRRHVWHRIRCRASPGRCLH